MTAPAHREYAGVVSRAVAYVLDALLVTVATGGAVVVVVLVGAAVSTTAGDFAQTLVPLTLAALPAVLTLYDWCFWTLAGRTPGMALLGVRVVTVDGGRVSWLAALVRAVVLAYFPVGALWAVVDRRGQGVHDKLARTTVVRVQDVLGRNAPTASAPFWTTA
ncbi:RDD family protein [Phytohabitans rumicis]|uniref:RDD domain-containing protein n=1 Tax=Phytohabitans rumicis TaxID=1076125 RepID=A0A6V8LIP0_9ACTN|nr:RDD family protein [Phytohabitans rumicis]GFJ96064.1 hypothetical protein Prum_097060 [Phytohabitans rumicis]